MITEKKKRIRLLFSGDGEQIPYNKLSEASQEDLDLSVLLSFFRLPEGETFTRLDEERLKKVLSGLLQDSEPIRYRQEIFTDIKENKRIQEVFTGLLSKLRSLGETVPASAKDEPLLYELARRLGKLEDFVYVVDTLVGLGAETGRQVRAEGLRNLFNTAHGISEEKVYKRLKAELPDLLSQIRGAVSITIGINLDHRLRPKEASLLSVSNKAFSDGKTGIFGRLFGEGLGKGIAPLHSAGNIDALQERYGSSFSPIMVPLFRDLADVMDKSCTPILKALRAYDAVNCSLFAGLREDIIFFLGAVHVYGLLEESGLPVCMPEIRRAEEKKIRIEDNFNINLALRRIERKGAPISSESIVKNDIDIDAGRPLQVLTGPNRGGKTTYTQSFGLSVVLSQIGLPVPGKKAEISPVDRIFTHFPKPEVLATDTGRFGEEAARLKDIFNSLGSNSLILLNESLASTAPSESVYLAQDLLRVIRSAGSRLLFSTHLHELASSIDELNREFEEAGGAESPARIISLVAKVEVVETEAGTEEVKRTFKIVPGPPEGQSYAREIAKKYGIRYDQLMRTLADKGIVADIDGE